MTHPTPKPCPCGGGVPHLGRLNRQFWWECDRCSARTIMCPDPATALRVWNASVDAADPECTPTVPLFWEINEVDDALHAGTIQIGSVHESERGWRYECLLGSPSTTYNTREAARAALLAHVMGR